MVGAVPPTVMATDALTPNNQNVAANASYDTVPVAEPAGHAGFVAARLTLVTALLALLALTGTRADVTLLSHVRS